MPDVFEEQQVAQCDETGVNKGVSEWEQVKKVILHLGREIVQKLINHDTD